MTFHRGRSWVGHHVEDACPCPQEPCGLVAGDRIDPTCTEHPAAALKSIRQGHEAPDCPGPDLRAAVAMLRTEQPADTIRRAADLMRTRATAATRGPWLSMDGGDRLVHDPGHDLDPPEYVVDEPMSNAANAEHIAGMDPLVAVAVAGLLEQLARVVDEHGFYGTPAAVLALDVARTYLGRSE
ncbi:hypothetical protein [Embleya sp. NPDC001921]